MTAVAERPVEVKAQPIRITKPGVYDIPEDIYHADPVPGGSLSSSQLRAILKCPAKFRYEQLHGRKPRKAFDYGAAAHKYVLGSGPKIVEVDANDYRTKRAQELRDAAHADGAIPMLPAELAKIQAMAEAIRQHPTAGPLFDPRYGQPERSLFWQDERTGQRLRARFDWLPDPRPGRMIIPDFKTAASADQDDFAKATVSYGYHQQNALYVDGAKALKVADDDAQFVFVVQEKEPPYVVTVIELDPAAVGIGRYRNRQAIDMYRECVRTDVWPGYHDDVAMVSLPAWEERKYSNEEIFRD